MHLNRISVALGLLTSVTLSGVALTYASPPYPFPPGQMFQGNTNFATLINHYAEGRPKNAPWAGYWWPYTGNGIATHGSGGSAAGKYDAARGHTTHAQEWELAHHGATVPQVQHWWGHGLGWCNASILFPEPKNPVTVNGVTFGVADLKGLLTEVAMEVDADYYGNRVESLDNLDDPSFWDVVPNQFFLVLTHEMGKQKKGIILDRYTGHQGWYQPIAGYRFEYPQPSDYRGRSHDHPNLYSIHLKARVWWMDDAVPADYETQPFEFQEDEVGIGTREFEMELWLDGPVVFDRHGKVIKSGNVVQLVRDHRIFGGVWKMAPNMDAWPDVLIVPQAVRASTGYRNPELNLKWIQEHLLVSGGKDDPSVTPGPIIPAPEVRPSRDPAPWPPTAPMPFFPFPSADPTRTPDPWPTTEPGGHPISH